MVGNIDQEVSHSRHSRGIRRLFRSRPVLAPGVSEGLPESSDVDGLSGEPLVRIAPPQGRTALRPRELWTHHELLYFLVWRDLKVRYKQVALGASWIVLQPIVAVAIFSLLFGRLLKVPSEGVPYAAFMFAALLPWQFFLSGVNRSANSLVGNQQLITKIYFPRILLPIAAVLSGFVDFGVALVVFAMLLLYYGIVPSAAMLLLPLFLLAVFGATLAVGLWLSALSVRYRDVAHVLPFLAQFWFFATPVAYSSMIVPDPWRTMLGLNPMAGIAEGFRWALLGQALTVGPMILISLVVSAVLLVGGVFYFGRMETSFADEV